MKTGIALFCIVAVLATRSTAAIKELSELRVLYLGSERTEQFEPFLKRNVARIEARSRAGFKQSDAAGFDVVLLDWPQGEETREMRKLTSPLGARESWSKPTVLLGSAGLNLAVAWKLKGGTGCTCMDPLAYGLREHEIFNQPLKIDRTRMERISTPPDFRSEIKAPEIEILPLVHDRSRKWRAGWCSYSYDFEQNPDVEVFCGGVNSKTPTAAGLWRQGNLFHFGFEQSPTEMNQTGQQLLLNAIAYISRFTEDRPIAITPSVFAGPVARSRGSLARALRNPEYRLDWLKQDIAPALWAKLHPEGRDKMAEWAAEQGRFLHPTSAQQLDLDQDLVALGVPFDAPEFYEKVFAKLRGSDSERQMAKRLLERYAPAGVARSTADEWESWWRENNRYAFASDAGDYRWYIDPLAKKRGVATGELRGVRRADGGSR